MKKIINLIRKKLVICLVLLIAGVCVFPVISGEENGNSPPVADAGGPYEGYEGTSLSLDASGSFDPDGDNLIYNWDLDADGFVEFREWFDSPYLEWTWYDDYHGTVTVFVIDDHGIMDSDTALVDIYNIAPEITSLEGLSNDPISIGATVELTSDFTDPGTLDTHIAEIDWGDDTISEGIIDDYVVTSSHSYEEAGVYTVKITVTDDDGGSDVEIFQYIVVYNPDSGFVTGGGWIISPEGAYTLDTSLSGKATFGFISKYKKGQSTPSGNTEFQFHAAGMNFHSESYDWLVIAGSKAMYKGNGTINNEGNYGFKLTAIDEELTPSTDVDLFRIKIWDKDNNDEVIYDNMIGEDDDSDPTTEISGGQIKIHKN
ncbi:hypothetical protein AYK20_05965 [Thermoplasmatales archaeon SG8-52-1]|nr:MAG: hypothetical protein AYK20_05965 [Thermoplasmatales archaeon SG8-52-1]